MDENLIKTLCSLTDLPADCLEKHLKKWLLEKGVSPQTADLEDIRSALMSVLQDVFTEVVDGDHPMLSLSDSVSQP